MLDFYAIVEGGRIVPLHSADAAELDALSGERVRVVLTQPKTRSPTQLRLWWGFCAAIAENFSGAEELDRVAVSDLLKLEVGHAFVFRDRQGRYRRLPRSISFNAMAQADFNGFMDQALQAAGSLFGVRLAAAAFREVGLETLAEAHRVP